MTEGKTHQFLLFDKASQKGLYWVAPDTFSLKIDTNVV